MVAEKSILPSVNKNIEERGVKKGISHSGMAECMEPHVNCGAKAK